MPLLKQDAIQVLALVALHGIVHELVARAPHIETCRCFESLAAKTRTMP